MCLSPIKIRNNSRSFESGFSPLYREVPCGHCTECQSAIQSDWFVRLAYEFLYNKNLGGLTYFVTLTYNDAELPFNYVDELTVEKLHKGLHRLSLLDEKIAFKCKEFEYKFNLDPFQYVPFGNEYFDGSDITKFIKSLRQILDYKCYYPYDEDHTLKYFVAPEYGEKMHRVHLHCLFFCPFSIDSKTFLELVKQAWSCTVKRADLPEYICKLIDNKHNLPAGLSIYDTPNGKHWQDWFINKVGTKVYVKHLRGNCSYSKDNPPYITGVLGLNYVVKYVHKKDEYLSSEKFNLLSAWLQLFPRCIVKEFGANFTQLEKLVKVLRAYFPHVRTSNYLGISILDEFQMLDDDTIAKMLVDTPLSVAGVARTYRVPAYIANRLMYNVDDVDTSLRVLSHIGIKVVKNKLDLRIEQFVKDMENVKDTCLPFLCAQDYECLKRKYPFTDCLKTGVFPYDLNAVANYQFLFRNVEKNINCTTTLGQTWYIIDTFRDDLFNRHITRNYDLQTPPSAQYKREVKLKMRNTWNMELCFAGFDEFLDFYRDVRNLVASNKEKKRREEYLEKVRLRQKYISPKYLTN